MDKDYARQSVVPNWQVSFFGDFLGNLWRNSASSRPARLHPSGAAVVTTAAAATANHSAARQ